MGIVITKTGHEPVYLDNSATTRVKPEVAEIVCNVMTKDFGNPSSLHRLGLDAEKIVKEAKRLGFKKVILPARNAEKLAAIEGIKIIGIKNLKEMFKK